MACGSECKNSAQRNVTSSSELVIGGAHFKAEKGIVPKGRKGELPCMFSR